MIPSRAAILVAVLSFGILTLWVPAQWPVAAFHLSAFLLCAFTLCGTPPAFGLPAAALGMAAIWGVLQLFLRRTETPFETTAAAIGWLALLALFIASVDIFKDSRSGGRVRNAMLWFAFAVSVAATLQCFTSGGKVFWIFPSGYTEGVMGPILYRNHYAAWIELILPFALAGAFGRHAKALLYGVMAAAMYASVVASGSRAGTVLCTAEVFLVPAIILVRRRSSFSEVAASIAKIGGVLAAFTTIVGWGTIWRRLTEPDPYFLRRELVESCIGMIRDRPWFGFGLGSWPMVYPAYAIIDTGVFVNRAHNDWLEWAADGGIPFALLFLAIAVWSIRPAFRTVWGIGVLSVFLHAVVDYPFSRPPLAAWAIVVIAMLAAADKGFDAA